MSTEDQTERDALEQLLREVIEEHAAFDRLAGSEGEARSARLLDQRLRDLGASSVIEPAEFLEGWAKTLAAVVAVPTVIGATGVGSSRSARLIAAVASAGAGWLVADDIANGRRYARRALRRRRITQNVVAELGDPAAPRTLVVLAHHDAARTGQMFDQRLQQALYRRFPERIEGIKTSAPYWWPAFLAPAAVAAGLILGRSGLRRGGGLISAVAFGLLADIARSPVVPGANDNLSGVAVLAGVADRLQGEVPEGLRILLVSAGAEEELQGGVYDFFAGRPELTAENTLVFAVDTVGSPQLVMLEGEGTVRMHDYSLAARDRVAAAAAAAGVNLERGLRSRFSTDAIVPSRLGIPTVSLVSLAPWRAPANYHLPSDTPENVDYARVADAVEITLALARDLAND